MIAKLWRPVRARALKTTTRALKKKKKKLKGWVLVEYHMVIADWT